MADDASEIFTQFRKPNRDKKAPFGPEKKKPVGKSPAGPVKPADSRAFEPQAPGVAGTGDGSFDKALETARRQRAATEQLTADIHDMRRQLPTQAPRAAATPHTTAAIAPVQLPSGMTAPLRPGLDSVISRADQLLGGSITRAAPNLAGVQQLAADLQQTNRNDPTAFRRPGLTPNLSAPIDDNSTFVDARGITHLRGPENTSPTREWDPALMDRIVADQSQSLDQGRRVGNSRAGEAMTNQRAQIAAQLGRGYNPRAVSPEEVQAQLGQNVLEYRKNRGAELASRQKAVEDRAKDKAMVRFQAMTARGNEPGGTTYDPVASANLGMATGMMMGRPDLAAELARSYSEGALHANQHASDAQRFRDQFNAQMGAQQAQLAEQSRHNRANEGISQTEAKNQGNRLAQEAITRDPLYFEYVNLVQNDPTNPRRAQIIRELDRRYGPGSTQNVGLRSVGADGADLFGNGSSSLDAAKRGILSPEYHKSLESYLGQLDMPGIDKQRSEAGWPFLRFFGIGPTNEMRRQFIRDQLGPVIANQTGLPVDSREMQALLQQFLTHFENRTSPAPVTPPAGGI